MKKSIKNSKRNGATRRSTIRSAASSKKYYFLDSFDDIEELNITFEKLKSLVLDRLNPNDELYKEAAEATEESPDAIFEIEWDLMGGDFEGIETGSMDEYESTTNTDYTDDTDDTSWGYVPLRDETLALLSGAPRFDSLHAALEYQARLGEKPKCINQGYDLKNCDSLWVKDTAYVWRAMAHSPDTDQWVCGLSELNGWLSRDGEYSVDVAGRIEVYLVKKIDGSYIADLGREGQVPIRTSTNSSMRRSTIRSARGEVTDSIRQLVRDILDQVPALVKVPAKQQGIRKEPYGPDHVCYFYTESGPRPGSFVTVEFHVDPTDLYTHVFVTTRASFAVALRDGKATQDEREIALTDFIIEDLEDYSLADVDKIDTAVTEAFEGAIAFDKKVTSSLARRKAIFSSRKRQ